MNIRRASSFERSYNKAPQEIQQAFDKQVQFLLENLRHPSLRAKKYDEGQDLWQARVTKDWRFYFTIVDDTYYIIQLRRHPK
jgi:mRNA interferase RelE/StbE